MSKPSATKKQPPTRAFGFAVREYRLKLGISQEELGFKCELDRTYISGIERGERNPTLKTIWLICDALGVPASALLRLAEAQAKE